MHSNNILNIQIDVADRGLSFDILFIIFQLDFEIILKILILSVIDSKTSFHKTTSEIGYIPFDREFDSTHSYV
jgi:hypothetical protein